MSEKENKLEVTALTKHIVKNSSLTFKQVNKMVTDKVNKFNGQISKLAAVKILIKELVIIMPDENENKGKDSPKESKDNWETVGYFDREKMQFVWKTNHKELLKKINPRVDQINDLLSGESTWEIVGQSELNRTEKGSAVFARKTKSGSGIGMFVGNNYVFISEKLWERNMEYMPVSMIKKGDENPE